MRWIISGLFIFFLAGPSFSLAQFSGDLFGQNINVLLDPQYPNPGEVVTATLDDYALGSVGSQISWSIDGQELTAEKNKRSITFRASTVGTSQTITGKIKLASGVSLENTQTINPLYTDIIVEPQTYTPLFYAGRALPTFGSTVVLTALIQNADGLLNPANYSYSWFLNDQALNGGAVRGGYKTEMTVPYGFSSTISLSVIDGQGTTIATKILSIPSVDLDLQFYETNILLGQSHRAIAGNTSLLANSTTIRAVPYYLSRGAVSSGVFTEWRVNNQKQNNSGDPFEITLVRQGSGEANVSFKIRNLSALIQSDQESFTIQY